MDATRCLRDEHQVILKMLACLEIAVSRARSEERVTTEEFAPLVEFFRGYADRCHHMKEEDRLFPRMQAKGVPKEGGPIGMMLYEHELGRGHVRAMADHMETANRGDAAAMATVLEHGDAFLELLRSHILKEDNVLFNMADALITNADLDDLLAAYGEAETDSGYCETIDRCRGIADRLFASYGVSAD